MGLTNFHSAAQLFQRSAHKHELQAMIQDFGRPIYVNYASFTQEVLEQYSWRLGYSHLDQWASPSDGTPETTLTKTPDPVRIPKLCIAPIFRPNLVPGSEVTDPFSKIDYLFLVEGNRGANQKLVIAHDLHEAGVIIFHEAMNGFSIVFSGAVPKSAFRTFLKEPANRGWKIDFYKAENIEQVARTGEYNFDEPGVDRFDIPVFC